MPRDSHRISSGMVVKFTWSRRLRFASPVRLRVHDPEAELLLLRHQLRAAEAK